MTHSTAGRASDGGLPDFSGVGFGAPASMAALTPADHHRLRQELGRPVRGALAAGYRCAHGVPAVVITAPRLPDGTPFPTTFYLCCRELNAAVSRMESAGLMRELQDRLGGDPQLAAGYRRAHQAYLQVRNSLADLGSDVSAGGMPDRVKCLHVLVAQALATGRGVNPLGDLAVDALGGYFRGESPCVRLGDPVTEGPAG